MLGTIRGTCQTTLHSYRFFCFIICMNDTPYAIYFCCFDVINEDEILPLRWIHNNFLT